MATTAAAEVVVCVDSKWRLVVSVAVAVVAAAVAVAVVVVAVVAICW